MLGSNKSTRIGDILIERGIISRAQLLQALDLQQARHLLRGADAPKGKHNEIGEILIELGFISQEQLKKNLARQNRLRKTTLAFTLVAPLFTMACGGGGGGSSAPPSQKPSQNNTVSSVVVSQSSSSKSSESPLSSDAEQSSVPPEQVSSAAVSSLQNSSAQSSKSSSSEALAIDGPVALYWTIPSLRENGDSLDTNEIGGYEVRYKLRNKQDFIYIRILDAFTDSYYFDYLKGNYEFEIAAIDTNGLYSQFVPINPAH